MHARSLPKSVLIVDDEPDVCELIRDELSEYGFDCSVATGPHRAREMLASRHFDLMVADILLPGGSGLDLLAYARLRARRCRVILITGASARREYLSQALMLGAHDYLEKPLRSGQLAEAALRAVSSDTKIPRLPARAAAAMDLSEQAENASLDSVRALVRAVEAKDLYTRRHSEQVAHYATNLARAVGLPEAQVESIRVASLLHDVGKIGVPDHILTKPARLTDAEFEHIRRHPALGAEIVANITLLRHESTLIRHHHERWDGKGYPDGLAAEEIPLAARIMNLADSVDAMLMVRSYKASYPVDRMVAELVDSAGSQFDPRLAMAAVQWCQRNPGQLVLPDGAPKVAADPSASVA